MGSIDQKEDVWAEYRKQPIEGRLFINGEFVDAKSGKTFDVINPATEKHAATIQEAGVEDVDAAVAAAKAAFPAWSELSAGERGEWVEKLANALEKRLKEMSYLDAISMGKPAANDSKFPLLIRNFRCPDYDLTVASQCSTLWPSKLSATSPAEHGTFMVTPP